jgi:hypothetical protein
VSQKYAIPDLQSYHYIGSAATRLLEPAMHTKIIRSAQSVGILDDSTPWLSDLCSILRNRWRGKKEQPTHDNLNRLDDRLLAELGLYRQRRIHNPRNRTDRQQQSPVPAALLGMWMPRI